MDDYLEAIAGLRKPCTVACDPDCPEHCHEAHEVWWKRSHDPDECHLLRGWWRCGNHFEHGPGEDLYLFLFNGPVNCWGGLG